ncbi:unnamed protein product [Anisakis simplex]|uniref:Solute carrier family 25 member 48 n=1 Tax=Anisakis simplex TaxID=6269 RepID=A0A0M3K5S2_ANISI|nr:unnamed protein product [Anisakis simplex]
MIPVVAGGAGLLIGHPLDTVKARLQTVSTYGGMCLHEILFQYFKSRKWLMNAVEFQVSGLYRGMLVPFATVGVLHSLLFAGYGATLRLLHPGDTHIDSRKDVPMSEIALATVVGSIIQLVPAVPIEVVKTNLQVFNFLVSNFFKAIAPSSPSDYFLRKSARPLRPKFKKKESHTFGNRQQHRLIPQLLFVQFIKGGTVMFHRDVIGYLFYIPVYEFIYRHLSKSSNSDDTLAQVIAGGTAGSLCWFSVCPLEVIKNRLQTSHIPSTTSCSLSLCKYAMQLYRREGFKTFYKGGLTLIVRGFPVNAVLFVVYSKSMTLLQDGTPFNRRYNTNDNQMIT